MLSIHENRRSIEVHDEKRNRIGLMTSEDFGSAIAVMYHFPYSMLTIRDRISYELEVNNPRDSLLILIDFVIFCEISEDRVFCDTAFANGNF